VNIAEVGGVGSCCDGDFEERGTGRVDGDWDEVRALRVRVRVRSCECGSQVEMDGRREDESSTDPTSVIASSSCSTSCFLRLDPLASEEDDWQMHCLHPSSSRRFTFSVRS